VSVEPSLGVSEETQLCDHLFQAPKYPFNLDSPLLPDFGTFPKDVTDAVRNAFPREAKIYDEAHIMFISWEENDIGANDEINRLREIMASFHLTQKQEDLTSHYKIKTPAPGAPLLETGGRLQLDLISKRLDYANAASKLLIVYYGGHGKVNEIGQSIWFAWKRRPGRIAAKSPEIN